MIRGAISRSPILVILVPVFLFMSGPASGQAPRLSQEILNRPLKRCSSPPGIDSNVKGRLWPGGIVPYVFDSNVTAAQQAAVIAAMKEWENVSPVRFISRTNQNDYIHIKGDTGNWSQVGKIGGKQEIGIYNWNSRFQMAHELCHTLGFLHEHQRPDRDTFVIIAASKVNDPQYRLEKDALVMSSYDFDSVMHGDSTHIKVITAHKYIWQSGIGQRDHLSIGDIRGMQIAYGQPDRPPSEYGFATTSTGFIPTFHTQGEAAVIGNSSFQLVFRNLTGSATGMFVISTGKASHLLAGMRIYVDPLTMIPLHCMASGTWPVQGSGAVTWRIAIPGIPSLTGTRLFLQGAFQEPGNRFCTTAGMWLTFQNSVSRDITCLYDRKAYQQHVTSATAGRQVWNANAVPGFSYVKTRQFTCGGETHWMVIVKHQQTGMEFCLIPGGSFRMGDINNLGQSNEKPVHWVHVEPFLLSRTEVPQGPFFAVMGSEPWKRRGYVKIGPAYAASYISWFDASTFCMKLGMRLPTESEWEYACQAGTTTAYHYGSNSSVSLGNYAWFHDNTRCADQKYPHQVGQKLPNAFGLHDMHGNDWEWCLDLYQSSYNGAPSNGRPLDGIGSDRVIRGGCWCHAAKYCRTAYRFNGHPARRDCDIGFRIARPLR